MCQQDLGTGLAQCLGFCSGSDVVLCCGHVTCTAVWVWFLCFVEKWSTHKAQNAVNDTRKQSCIHPCMVCAVNAEMWPGARCRKTKKNKHVLFSIHYWKLLSMSPVTDWRPVQDVLCLTPCDRCCGLQANCDPESDKQRNDRWAFTKFLSICPLNVLF